MMFILNEGYKWRSPEFADALHGVIYLPTGNHSERVRRKHLGDFSWRLIDPQLYLAGLDAAECEKVCARLATYPWFGITDLPEFVSGAGSQRDWEEDVRAVIAELWPEAPPEGRNVAAAARAAVEFQTDTGCSHVLLPTPLVSERENEAQSLAEWLDAGIEAVADLDIGQPALATVAIAEAALNEAAFEAGGFIDTIVDQVSSREGLGGVYIVVAQSQTRHPLSPSTLVARAYLTLTRAFSDVGYEFVFANFADVLGVGCLGLGGGAFATGPSQALRRLSLAAFKDDGGGLPLPKLYSHRVIGEFLPETDLAEIANRGWLRRVTDRTTFSDGLFDALQTQGSSAAVASWAESKNNVAQATRHFIERMTVVGDAYASKPGAIRRTRVERWLEDAVVEQDFLTRRLDGIDPTYARAEDWLNLYRALLR